ncbi:CDC27 family protein [Puniceicoccaceae bacterium K14]|nr:CDC27 family protein [Puniceicoccaceae bacterium K14]
MKSERFKKLVDQNPNNELFRFSLAQALIDEGEAVEAIEALDFCLEKKNNWMMAAILKGKCLISQKRKEDARPVLEHALKLAIEQHHEAPEAELRKLLDTL